MSDYSDKLSATIIGVIIGAIIVLIIVLIAYSTRSSIFFYCPRRIRGCIGADYIQTVDEAIEVGYTAKDVLSIRGDKLFFMRPRLSNECVPENPEVHIKYPKFCTVKEDGDEVIYELTDDRTYGANDRIYEDKCGNKKTLAEDCFSYDNDSAPLIMW